MADYVHRPTPIQAWQFTDAASLSAPKAEGIEVTYGVLGDTPFAVVTTPGGSVRMTVGEWFVLDDSGVIRVYNDEYFTANYETA